MDTIDHDNLFCILEKYVGIRGNGLKLIKSYLLIIFNVFKLMMFCQIVLILFVMFPRDRFQDFKIMFVLIANERDLEIS